MGQMVEFESNGGTCDGYIAGDGGPGVLVIQEWWGLNKHIKSIVDRLAAEGFVALAPDLYHGEVTTEPDGAGKLMMALNISEASKEMSGAIDLLIERTGRNKVGVIGFCMGGMLSLILAAQRSDRIAAAVPFYGFPQGDAEPDWSGLTAAVRGHMAEHDDFFGPDAARALEAKLQGLGKDVQFTVHPGTGHAFMGPHNALGTLDEEVAAEIWPEVVTFLHEQLA